MALVSMKRDPKEAAADSMPSAIAGDAPMYSYGTKLCLDDDALKKLGIPLPTVGQKFAIVAIAECTRASAEKVQEGDAEIGCDLQITDMSVTAEGGQDPHKPFGLIRTRPMKRILIEFAVTAVILSTLAVAQTSTRTVAGVFSDTTGSLMGAMNYLTGKEETFSLNNMTGPLSSAKGGTGIANNAGSTLTLSGVNALTLTTTSTTNVTLPTSGTLAAYTAGSAVSAVCWKADAKTLGYCSTVIGADGACTCN